VQSAAPDFIE